MEPGIWQIVIVVLIIVVFFGAKKIPEFAKGIGEGISEFKKATNQSKKQVEEGGNLKSNEPVESSDSEEAKQKAQTE